MRLYPDRCCISGRVGILRSHHGSNGRFFVIPGGWVTSAPRKITGSLKTLGRILGTRILLTPPNL